MSIRQRSWLLPPATLMLIAGILIAGDPWGIATIIGMILTVTGVWLSSRTIE